MASGNSLLLVPAWAGVPTSSNGATFDTRNSHACADFDDSTDESLIFSLVMPQHYAGGGVTVYLFWSATDPTVGPDNVVWDVAFERIADDAQDVDSIDFAAVNSVTDTEASVSGEVSVPSISFTDGADMDSVTAGDMFRVKVTRDADNVSDDLVGDAELHHVHIKET